ALDDWGRLLDYSKSHDVAYGIYWLRKLYGEATITLTQILARERQLDRDFAEAMTYLNDSTLHEWLDRLKAQLAGREGADVFAEIIDGYIEMSTKGQERKQSLRENRLIAALFALHSPIFYSINVESFKELCLSSFERLQISDNDIEQCNDFFNYITKHKPEEAKELAQMCYYAAKAAGGKELIAYAGGNMAVALAPSDKPEDLRLALQHLKESRSLFLLLDPQHTALGAIEINLKRFTGRLAKVGQSYEPVQRESRPEEALKTYNEKIRVRDFAGARQSLDVALEEVDRNDSLWMDLNALAGQTLLGEGRIDDAYKRLYRLQNAIAEGSSSNRGYYEAFHAALLLRSGDTKGTIEIAADAIKRLAHICPLDVLSILTVTLSAAYTESGDPDAAIALIKKYEYAFESRENRLFLRANLAFARLIKGEYEEVVSISEDLLDMFDLTSDPSLKFDVCHHFAEAKLRLYQKEKGDFESTLAAFDQAEQYVEAVNSTKLSLFYRDKAELLELQGRLTGERRGMFEQGFAAAEKAFHEVARLTDDINDRNRLMDGLKRKVFTFPTYLRLFDIYAEEKEWLKLYSFCQRFKATFLIEAFFSNSENMVAKKGAKWMAGLANADNKDALDGLYMMSVLIKTGGPGKLREFLRGYMIEKGMVEGSQTVLPVSVEHLEPEMAFISMENLERAQEVSQAMTFEFLNSQLSDAVAVVEFFPYEEGDSIGALIIQKGQELRFAGKFEKPKGLDLGTLFEHEQIDATRLASNTAAFKTAFAQLGSQIGSQLGKGIKELVFCPTSWMTNLPLHALTFDGDKCIADLYRCIYNASATMYALSATRTRARNNSGFAIIDPRSEMVYAHEEAAILSSNSTIKFKSIVRGPLTWDQLKDAAKDAYWIHVSAHGYQDSRFLGLFSGLETGPRTEDMEGLENLSALSAFLEYFPDLGTSVVVLSSCYAGEVSSLADEPVGVPTALLTGGAKAVIAPMWKVDEFSTVVFMEHFYERLKEVKTVAEAIHRAQIALRNLTTSVLLQKLDAILAKPVSSKRKIESYRDFLAKNFAASDFPYSDPYYWSAFSLIGCNVKLA
ncbi:MAG TPA: CHAT domain-containing protein, partial [Anaerolineales bacterium]|nr:CHAT domain-containing protein [Anaerolineales bacterium]